jgi:hypothetical protein
MRVSSSPSPRRPSSPASMSLRVPIAAVAALLLLVALGAPAQALGRDRKPPVFAGLKSATTCIPGPIGGERTTSYHLTWEAATDNRTPSAKIVYEIYQATTPGGEDFSSPTYTTAPGVTSFDTPQLSIEKSFYFVVRARDRRGNEDANKIEREGQNLCD